VSLLLPTIKSGTGLAHSQKESPTGVGRQETWSNHGLRSMESNRDKGSTPASVSVAPPRTRKRRRAREGGNGDPWERASKIMSHVSSGNHLRTFENRIREGAGYHTKKAATGGARGKEKVRLFGGGACAWERLPTMVESGPPIGLRIRAKPSRGGLHLVSIILGSVSSRGSGRVRNPTLRTACS